MLLSISHHFGDPHSLVFYRESIIFAFFKKTSLFHAAPLVHYKLIKRCKEEALMIYTYVLQSHELQSQQALWPASKHLEYLKECFGEGAVPISCLRSGDAETETGTFCI